MYEKVKSRLNLKLSRLSIFHRYQIASSAILVGNIGIFIDSKYSPSTHPVFRDWLIVIMCFIFHLGMRGFLLSSLRLAVKDKMADSIILRLFGWGVFVSVIVYALGYYQLALSDPKAFKGIVVQGNPYAFVDFLYYSAVTFATVGYGDILPVSVPARMLCFLQIFESIRYLIVFISQFGRFEVAWKTRAENPDKENSVS